MVKMEKMELDRRSFLKGAAGLGAIGAVAGLVGCAPDKASGEDGVSGSSETDAAASISSGSAASGSAQANGELTWLTEEPEIAEADIESEITADVVIVGCGLAGTCATRAAAEEGASVAVFEKASGPQCRSGEYAVLNGEVQARWGRDNFDTDLIVDHEMDEMSYFPKRAILSRWAEEIGEVFPWFIAAKKDLYICEDYFTPVPEEGQACALYPFYYPLPEAYDWTQERHPTYPTSVGFSPSQEPVVLANFEVAQNTSEVTPYWGHFVEKLIVENGRVVGCYARNSETGKYVKATASKGLVLSSGEYGSNQELVDYYCPEVKQNDIPLLWMNMDVEGNPTNTGDGLKLGAWIDAAIQQHHAPMIHWMGVEGMGAAPYLRLNLHGKRFMNEDMPGQQVENQIEGQPGKTIWQFWDNGWPEQIPHFQPQHGGRCYVGKLPEGLSILGAPGFVDQEDLDACVEAGTVLKADTLDALLDLIPDMDKATALASIERYNELAAKGSDDDFAKVPNRLFALDKPPFYAASSGVSAMLVCCGGLVSDEEARVYDNNDEIIPGIYVAGNIQGSRYAIQYPIALKGISHSLCVFYGYVAGKNAVAGV